MISLIQDEQRDRCPPHPSRDQGADPYVHREGDTRVSVEAARYAAEKIPNAKLFELPGIDHLIWVGDTDAITDAAQEFLTGSRADVEPDRVLATLLVTDIVDSTNAPLNSETGAGTPCWPSTTRSYDES